MDILKLGIFKKKFQNHKSRKIQFTVVILFVIFSKNLILPFSVIISISTFNSIDSKFWVLSRKVQKFNLSKLKILNTVSGLLPVDVRTLSEFRTFSSLRNHKILFNNLEMKKVDSDVWGLRTGMEPGEYRNW